MPPPTTTRRIRFAAFEVDFKTGELHKNGFRVKLQVQPLKILEMLVEHPGEVVTREELQKAIWSTDTFVDFEHGLNKAVNKLREALSDTAEHPRFIETLPRRGYRFIHPVETVEAVAAMSSSPVGGGDAAATVGAGSARRREGKAPPYRYAAIAAGLIVATLAALLALNVAGLRDRLLRQVGAVHETPLQIRSIAVLPLENLSHDPEQEYFADGMTDELITNLGKISALRVISRQSTMRYKGSKKPLPEIAKELNVDAVVEGTVQRSGDRVRITANLLHAPTDRHLWAETYERDLRDVLALQSDVAHAITKEIRIKVKPEEQARLASNRPVNRGAYDAYLKGLHARLQADEEMAARYFRQAIEMDPTYAPAFAALARTYASNMHISYEEAYPKAASAASKALELDDSLGEAHAGEALVNFRFRWDWDRAGFEFRRALELNPSSSYCLLEYGRYLTLIGRFDEALSAFNRAVEVDPYNQMARHNLGWAYGKARRYDEAIDYLRELLALDPNWYMSRYELAHAYARKRMYAEAVVEAEKAKCWEGCGWIYAVAGRKEKARAIVKDLIQGSKEYYVDPGFIAFTYAGLGEREKALEWLEEGYRRRSRWMTYIKVEPEVDNLRSDPRFQALLRRMNFPP